MSSRVHLACLRVLIAVLNMQDAGTTYFNESADEARKLAEEVLKDFEGVLSTVSEERKGILTRSMGLKMEQLKAEIKELEHAHDDD